MISRTPGSPTTGANGFTTLVNISGNGSAVTYFSEATNLFSSQNESPSATTFDIFHATLNPDGTVNTVKLITHVAGDPNTPAGVTHPDLFAASISDDGNLVAYTSTAANLVTGQVDAGGFFPSPDTFLYNATSGTSVLVSHVFTSATTSDASFLSGFSGSPPQISGNGAFVAFASDSKNLLSTTIPTGTIDNIYIYNVNNPTTVPIALVSHTPGSLTTPTGGAFPSISNDGAFVVFLGVNAAGTDPAIVKYATNGGAVTDVGLAGASSGFGDALLGVISGDGSTVVFNSTATSFPGITDTNGVVQDVFIDRAAAGTPPVTSINLFTTEVPATPNTTISQFTVTGGTPGGIFQYTLVPGTGDTHNNLFTVQNNDTLRTTPQFTAPGVTNLNIRVEVLDVATGLTVERPLTLQLITAPSNLRLNQSTVPATPTTPFAQFAFDGQPGRTYVTTLNPGSATTTCSRSTPTAT